MNERNNLNNIKQNYYICDYVFSLAMGDRRCTMKAIKFFIKTEKNNKKIIASCFFCFEENRREFLKDTKEISEEKYMKFISLI